MRRALTLLAVLVAAGCASSTAAQEPRASADVAALASHLRTRHPNLFHDFPRARFAAERTGLAERIADLEPHERLVELMRFAALAGVRDGHTGIFPLDPAHRRALHLFPLRLYDFPDGIHVVAEVGRRRGLVGRRVVAVNGIPIREALRRVRPLVPRDNDWSLRARAVQWLLTAEVLHGLGLSDDSLRATFTLAAGRELELRAVPARTYAAAFPDLFHPMVPQGLPRRPSPPFLRNRERTTWTRALAGGRAVYVAYNVTTVPTYDLAQRVARMARQPGVDRVILDLRHNPGGDNFTYPPLLDALRELPRRVRLYVLVGRTTFSAAQNLAAELERQARPVFVGEATGGSPNLYGDPASLQLPESGWNAHVATVYWVKSSRGDTRLTIRPDLPVRYTAADFRAGRDPVLNRALAAS